MRKLFWDLIDKSGEHWLWLGYTDPDGYGRSHGERVHRKVYRELIGPIPERYEIDHKCKVRNCVLPDHLEAVTSKENVNRSVNHNRIKTHCKNGHEFTPENTYLYRDKRDCRTCRSIAVTNHRTRITSLCSA